MSTGQQTLIRVGHSAYKGVNAVRLCFSRAQAIRVLCNRGVKRDEARSAVARAMADGGSCAYGEYSQCVEITNEEFALSQGWYLHTYPEMKSTWSKMNEF